ncbi:MAG: hypothetical protein D6780_04775 [Candidatus Dadabacteria bacterium]|nr:MAG: hypothetical protein D6780_04775 [Candidatus Dadabacteria bacterium]
MEEVFKLAPELKEQVKVIVTFNEVLSSFLKIFFFDSILTKEKSSSLSRWFSGNEEATILYTSGTTGQPKGVVSTHKAHLENIRQVEENPLFASIKSVFHFLPQAHAFGMRMVHICLLAGATSYFPKKNRVDKAGLFEDIRFTNPEVIPVVPKVLERIRQKVLSQLKKDGIKGFIVRLVIKHYEKEIKEREEKGTAQQKSKGFITRALESFLLGRIGLKIKNRIKENIVGRNFKFFISGGAALQRPTLRFFWALDMPVLEGYGSTEANVVLTVNTPKEYRLGSVGKPISPDVKLKVDNNGELLVKSPSLASGYLNRPDATNKQWNKDGWYRTNDLAVVDEEGFLWIKGRLDDVLVTTTGENIQSWTVEERLKRNKFISEAVVVGDGRPALIALIVPDKEALLEEIARIEKKRGQAVNLDLEKITKKVIYQAVKKFNEHPSTRPYERIRGFIVIPPLKINQGLTPTLKVQRKKVIALHRRAIEALYEALENQPAKEKVFSLAVKEAA